MSNLPIPPPDDSTPAGGLLADLRKLDANIGIRTVSEYGRKVILLLDNLPAVELATAVNVGGYRLQYLLGVLKACGGEAVVRVVSQVEYATASNRPVTS